MQDEEKDTDDFDDAFLDDEDDFDFDDIDDSAAGDLDDDLGDDSWDDFDDIPDAEIKESAGPDAPKDNEQPADEQPVKKKSLPAAKNFKLIVVAVAALGGGGLFLSQMGGAPTETFDPAIHTDIMAEMPVVAEPSSALPDTDQQQAEDDIFRGPEALEEQPEEQLQESVVIDIDEAPPQPAPMSSPPQPAPAPIPGNEVLTPMPEMAALSEQQQLASLEEPLEELAITEAEEEPEPEKEEETPPVLFEPEPEMQVEDTSQPPAPPVSNDDSPEAVNANEMPEADIAAATVQENAEKLEEMDRKIQELEGKLADAADTSNELSSKISEKDNKISELNSTIAKLEERIAEMSKQDTPPPAPPEKKNQAAAPSAPVVQPTVKPKESVSSTKSPSGNTTTWRLRSAQPGKALVSEEGSSDFKTLTVGDSLKGLGRVVSIGLEDGKWVVTGTQGRISQ